MSHSVAGTTKKCTESDDSFTVICNSFFNVKDVVNAAFKLNFGNLLETVSEKILTSHLTRNRSFGI